MARILGIKRYMVPKLAAGLSAYGGLLSDVRWEESATFAAFRLFPCLADSRKRTYQ